MKTPHLLVFTVSMIYVLLSANAHACGSSDAEPGTFQGNRDILSSVLM